VSDDGIAGRPVVAVIGGGMAGLAAAWQLSQDLGG
jgi:cation diffusion facilitator CzcD-associated flavoprotein CzcO